MFVRYLNDNSFKNYKYITLQISFVKYACLPFPHHLQTWKKGKFN